MELASSYAVACDDHNIPLLTSLFTGDAEFIMQNGTMALQGRNAIVESFAKVFQARGPSYHWTHDHFLKFDGTDPDRATGGVLGRVVAGSGNSGSGHSAFCTMFLCASSPLAWLLHSA